MTAAFHDAATEGLSVDSFDVVIVGSGAGGGAAARTLAESGLKVIVLEEGPYVQKARLGFQVFESMKRLMRHNGQMAALGKAAIPILQARVVGGTTFVNSAIIWRIPEKVLAKWHEQHGLAQGMSANDLSDAYDIIERDMSVRPVGDDIANGADLKMALGADRLGMKDHRPIRRNEKGCMGTGRCLHGCPHNAKQSTAINYLVRAAEAGAAVFANAKVERIVTQGGRAVGVAGTIQGKGPQSGKPFQVNGKRAVIVSASVIQSPNLLRRSGVGGGNTALGNHFMAHPGTSLVGVYPDRVNPWTGAAQGYEAFTYRDTLGVKFETINVPPEVAASRFPGYGPTYMKWLDKLPYMAIWSLAVKSDGEGTVRPSRLWGGDLIRYSMTTNDMDRVRQGLKKMSEMHFAAGALEVLPGVHGMPDSITKDQLDLYDKASISQQDYSMVATHLFGTCRAGKDPKHHVVDENLQVHGTPGLYVMDASVFPSNTGVNPQHTIMAISTVASLRLAAA